MKNKVFRMVLAAIMSLCVVLIGCGNGNSSVTTQVINGTSLKQEKTMDADIKTKEDAEKDISEKLVVAPEKNMIEQNSEDNEKSVDQNVAEKEFPEIEPIEKTDATEKLPEQQKNKNVAETKCLLSVRCDTILSNLSRLKKGKENFVPENGIIFEEKEVVFTEGESVFDVLLREMRNNKIHMEFCENSIYKTTYIEGINNIYEFDCGELSGWTYLVNGKTMNVGCSKSLVNNGDRIEWVFTCDMGRDIK